MNDITDACLALLKEMFDKQMPDKLYRVKNDVVWNDAVEASNAILRIVEKSSPNVNVKLSIDPLLATDLDLVLTIPTDETFTIEDGDMPDFMKSFSKANYFDIYTNDKDEVVVNIGFRKVLSSSPNQK